MGELMKFSLLDEKNSNLLIFPVAPEELTVSTNTETISYSTLKLGTVEIPRGRKPISITWRGILPSARQGMPYLESVMNPNDIVKKIIKMQDEEKKMRLIITDTEWNIPVFVSNFDPVYSGGLGTISYTITLTELREMLIKVSSQVKTANVPKRPVSKPKSKTYTVKKGDNLWNIAKKYTGKGARWTELWVINKSRSRSKNPNLIYPGEVFLVPKGW